MNKNINSVSARERILTRIRANHPASVEHPDLPVFPIKGNPVNNFKSHVNTFDGKVIDFKNREDAVKWLHDNIIQSDNCLVFSTIDGYEGNISLKQLPKPSDAHVLNSCVGEGILGIGETGSVLVSPETFGRMANGLFAINLYLLLDHNKIVDGLQDAYAMMDLSQVQYSSLFSGPSATADIEAVHITGAQGPVSLTVLLY